MGERDEVGRPVEGTAWGLRVGDGGVVAAPVEPGARLERGLVEGDAAVAGRGVARHRVHPCPGTILAERLQGGMGKGRAGYQPHRSASAENATLPVSKRLPQMPGIIKG